MILLKHSVFFDDYIHNFIKQDSKFKNVKVLSAKVHCNEVYYPRYEEIEKDGTTKLRRLSREESAKEHTPNLFILSKYFEKIWLKTQIV